MLKKIFTVISVLIFVSGCATSTPKKMSQSEKNNVKENCEMGINTLYADGECISARVAFGYKEGKAMFIIHGDDGTKRTGRTFQLAEELSQKTGYTVIALAMPGYIGSTSNRIGPMRWDRSCDHSWLKPFHTNYVANEVIDTIKHQYGYNELVGIGYSNGGSMLSSIMGQYPSLMDKAVLVGARPDMRQSCRDDGINLSGTIISGSDVVSNLKGSGMEVLMLVGKNDRRSGNSFLYKNQLNDNGIEATVVVQNNAGHNNILWSKGSINSKSVETIGNFVTKN